MAGYEGMVEPGGGLGEFDRRQEKWRAEMRQRDEIVWEARLVDGAIDLRPKPISKRKRTKRSVEYLTNQKLRRQTSGALTI